MAWPHLATLHTGTWHNRLGEEDCIRTTHTQHVHATADQRGRSTIVLTEALAHPRDATRTCHPTHHTTQITPNTALAAAPRPLRDDPFMYPHPEVANTLSPLKISVHNQNTMHLCTSLSQVQFYPSYPAKPPPQTHTHTPLQSRRQTLCTSCR